MKPKIKCLGAPFDTKFSSCSDIKPVNFEWSLVEGDYLVHIDHGLFIEPESDFLKKKRFGWTCESSHIISDVVEFLKQKHNVLFDEFYNRIFTHDSSLLELDSRFVYCPNGSNYPWIRKSDWNIYEKSKLCSMFCSPKRMTEGHVYRHNVARLVLDKGFDVFGGAHGTPRTVGDPRNPWNTKLDGIKDYMFNIVIENGVYDSYSTEKLTDCFATGTIPVYWGTRQIPKIFDPEGIIWLQIGQECDLLESLSPELYANKRKAISNNLEVLNNLKLADDDLFEIIKSETSNT